jgi:RNA polymerase sigma factor (sigma-70 family)
MTVPFQRFLDEQRELVYRFLTAAVGPDGADDCFQETFMAALKAYPGLRPDSNVRAWVLTIAERKAIDHHRARARRPVPVADPEPRGTTEAPAIPDEDTWRAVRALPPKQRAAILLRYAGDLSHREVGAALGCSEEAARRSAHEGLKRLRQEVPAP